ncbi:hypothetical protein [Halalkalibacter hemicellulosilyticus]|uniref:Uncharacterized protein n=1 Tax=Halalkalibacter hemicellulosilyticusJCM 9152 TaxID=1236971 RepID=W4QDJ2_9BACI|nr:hypothetical protein [Halalkalibacter hemicellulosilyticus]GAE30007.1 hypothetical protein JCM9152_1398 [Halalkalibacter hemicellulosilyticusJCM 9152]
MKIGLLLVEESPAGVQQLIQTVAFQFIQDHELFSIEINDQSEVKVQRYQKEQILFSQEFEAPMIRPSHLRNEVDPAIFDQFDQVVVLGEKSNIGNDLLEKLTISHLHIPLIDGDTGQNLGYDTALDSIVDQILKVKDTINSMKYDHPRIFGIQLPEGLSENLIQDVVVAVNEHRIQDMLELEGIATLLKQSIANGKTYGFIIFDEHLNPNEVVKQLEQYVAVDWKYVQIDQSLILGPYPSGADRLIANKLAQKIIQWCLSHK